MKIELDLVSVFLGIITVFIFMVVFTLLRAMTSPFIKRFEKIFGGTIKKLSFKEDSYYLPIKQDGRTYELFEVKQKAGIGEKTAYNNFIFLKVHTRSELRIKISNSTVGKNIINILGQMLETSRPTFELGLQRVHIDGLLTGLEISTNNVEQARRFLSVGCVRSILTDFKTPYGKEFIMPLFIEPGNIVLDYRLTAQHLNGIINNPRVLKKHIKNLQELVNELEKLEEKS